MEKLKTAKSLLSKQHGRQLKLLEFFSKNTHGTAEILRDLTNCEHGTLKNDIEILNTYINPSVIKYQNKQFCLILKGNMNYFSLFSKLLQNSLEVSIIEAIFFEKNCSFNSLAVKLFVSNSTLRRIINKLNESLKEEDIFIQFQPMEIIGNEKKIRRFISTMLFEKYYGSFPPFSESEKKFAFDMLKILPDNLAFKSKKLDTFFLVSMSRIKRGYNLLFKIPPKILIDYLYEMKTIELHGFSTYHKNLYMDLGLKVIMDVFSEFEFILCMLKKKEFETNIHEMDEINVLTKSILGTFPYISIEDDCICKINFAIKCLIFLESITSELFIEEIQDFNNNFKNEFPDLTNLLLSKINCIFDNNSDRKKEFILYSVIINFSELILYDSQKYKKIQIGIYYDVGRYHSLYIKKKILEKFPSLNKSQIDIISYNLSMNESEFPGKKYDLIVSNIPKKKAEFGNCKYVFTSLYLTEFDLETLKKMFFKWDFS